jgi:hypothetical protein
MRRPILLGLALLMVCSVESWAGRLEEYSRLVYQKDGKTHYGRHYYESPSGEVYFIPRGKRGRKYARRFSLRENLKNDKRRIYDEFGYTPHRLGFNEAGRRTERWKYYTEGLEFLFDSEGYLLEVHRFSPEDNHID